MMLLVFKGNKASGPSPVPSQLVRHLAPACIPALSRMFFLVAKAGIPAKWNEVRVMPVFKKGDSRLASNYRPVSMIGPITKLYSTCMNLTLTRQAAASDVQRETTGGKFPGNSRFPGNGREKFEPREFPSYGNLPWLGKFPCHWKFPYSRGHNFLVQYPNYNLKKPFESS